MKRKALGKGLSALLPDPDARPAGGGRPRGPDRQPRAQPLPAAGRDRPRGAWRSWPRSIRESGMVQPILVRRAGARYQIIAGERRWRAAQKLGLATRARHRARRARRPAAGAGPGREHPAPGALAPRGGPRLPAAAGGVPPHPGGGRAQGGPGPLHRRQHPAPAAPAGEVRELIAAGRLDAGHARALLALERRRGPGGAGPRGGRGAASRCARWSAGWRSCARAAPRAARRKDPNTRAAEERLRAALGTRVQISRRGKGGTLRIAFASEAELQRLFDVLVRGGRGRG